MVIDAGSGRVIAGHNDRTPLPPASTTKVLTALTAIRALPPSSRVPVSRRAARMPASRVEMRAGQVWSLRSTVYATLLSSANDASTALAERTSGSVDGFGGAMRTTAAQLGLADRPVLQDPTGLDDAASVGGGNRISARDLAIIARAALAEPRLAPVLRARTYRFTDPTGEPRALRNHNKLLTGYPGAAGVKTGYTMRAGHCLISAARRNGRTIVTVVLGDRQMYKTSAALLDHGFSTKAAALRTKPRLPPLPAPIRR